MTSSSTDTLTAAPPAKSSAAAPALDLRGGLAGKSVRLVGKPASMSADALAELVESRGGRVTYHVGAGVAFVVVGQGEWPLNADGTLRRALREARLIALGHRSSTKIITEEQFLSALGLEDHTEALHRLYSTAKLTQLLGIGRERVRAWVKAGLIEPASTEHGVWYFDFRQVSAAKTLCDLATAGVKLGRIRLSLQQLKQWMPEAQRPLEQLSVIEGYGADLMVRLAERSLAEADGQLRLDFEQKRAESAADQQAAALPTAPFMRIVPGPRTAGEWYVQGVEQEQEGLLAEAAESYRGALLLGGPDADVCFNLANALLGLGQMEAALERYRQVVEIRPDDCEGWNNLGLALQELKQSEEAHSAYRRALSIDPTYLKARFNLADLLDELGRAGEAAEHWREYLRLEQDDECARYARRRLA